MSFYLKVTSISFLLILIVCSINFAASIKNVRVYSEQGDYARALILVDSLLIGEPDNRELIAEKARIYAWNGEYLKSLDIFYKLIESSSNDEEKVSLLIGCSRVESWSGKLGKAKNRLDEAVAIAGQTVETRLMYARFAFWQGDFKLSASVLDSLLIDDPENVEILELRMNVASAAGSRREASVFAERILQINPGLKSALRTKREGKVLELSAGYSFENLDSGRDDWRAYNFSLVFKPELKKSYSILIERFERYGLSDAQAMVAVSMPVGEKLMLELNAGAGFEHEFASRFRTGALLSVQITEPFIVSGGVQYLDFESEDVVLYTAGATYYFPLGWYIDYRYFYGHTSLSTSSNASVIKLSMDDGGDFKFNIGGAVGSEAYETVGESQIMDFNGYSVFANLNYMFSVPVGMYIGLSYNHRENSFNRKGISAGLTTRF